MDPTPSPFPSDAIAVPVLPDGGGVALPSFAPESITGDAISDLLVRVAASNLVAGAIGALLVLCLAVLLFRPGAIAIGRRAEGMIVPRRARGGTGIFARLSRSLRDLRTPDRPVRDQVTTILFRDGSTDSAVIIGTDFFLLLQVAAGIAGFLFAIIVYALFFTFPPVIAAGAGFYLVPMWIATRYNSARRDRLARELPIALTAVERRVASGLSISEAIRMAGDSGEGPIFSEIAWAGRQMAAASSDDFEILRDIDRRNGTTLFTAVASQLERSRRQNRRAEIATFIAFCDRVRDDQDNNIEEEAEKVPGKVISAMTPFLVIAILLSAFGPLFISAINGGGPLQ